ncbi:unnamed protein product [Urochloa humidicola]
MEAKKTKHGGAVGISLPDDVIFDVLSWLPVRSLCRFRCVSKAWRVLISDPAFAATQRSRAGAAPLLAGVFTAAEERRRELRVMDTNGNVVRVIKDVEGTPVPARLDLVCLDGGAEHGAQVIDPATGEPSPSSAKATLSASAPAPGSSSRPGERSPPAIAGDSTSTGSAVLCRPVFTRSSAATLATSSRSPRYPSPPRSPPRGCDCRLRTPAS